MVGISNQHANAQFLVIYSYAVEFHKNSRIEIESIKGTQPDKCRKQSRKECFSISDAESWKILKVCSFFFRVFGQHNKKSAVYLVLLDVLQLWHEGM